MLAIQKRKPPKPTVDSHILAMWLLYCRAPGKSTAPGEPVDLGEIGQDREKDWERLTPYSPARRPGCSGYIEIAG